MNAIRKLILLTGAGLLALALVAGPAFADVGGTVILAAEETGDAPAGEAEEVPADEAPADDGRIAIAEGPRDIFALLMLGALVVGGGVAWRNARRQISGDRPQASGEFRWR